MIIETDFPDHWKTQLLVKRCGPEAVLCLLRIWAHCQLRKTGVLVGLSHDVFEAIAKWQGEEKLFYKTLAECRFSELGDEETPTITMHEFEIVNSKLVRNWTNGAKGGRKPNANPNGTQTEPNDNPSETQEEPSDNPDETQTEPIDREIDREIDRKKSGKKKNTDSAFAVFCAELDKMMFTELTAAELAQLKDGYKAWCAHKAATKKSYKPATGAAHAKKIYELAELELVTAAEILGLWDCAMQNEYDGWIFDDSVLKIKANRGKRQKNNPPPADDYTPGSSGIPDGARQHGKGWK